MPKAKCRECGKTFEYTWGAVNCPECEIRIRRVFKDVKNYLAALKVLSKHKNIEVKKCKLKGNEYALTHDKQFDFDIELEKAEQALIQIQKEEEAKELQEKTRAFLDNYVK